MRNYLRSPIICVKKTTSNMKNSREFFIQFNHHYYHFQKCHRKKIILLFIDTINYIHYCLLTDQDLNPQKTKRKVITGILTLSQEMCKDEEKKFIRNGFIDWIKNEPRVLSCNCSHLFTKGNFPTVSGGRFVVGRCSLLSRE